MLVSAEFAARVEDLEEKGLIRRVRTAAGMRVFGQPIGTVITRDIVPKRRKNKKQRAKSNRTKKARAGVHRYIGPDEEKGKNRYWNPTRTTIRGLPVPSHSTEWVSRTSDGFILRRRKQGETSGNPRWLTRVDDEYDEFTSNWTMHDNENDGYDAVEKALNALRQEKQQSKPQRRKRDYDGLMDHYQGVYGLDWLAEGDAEYDFSNPDQRRIAADIESNRLGIRVDGALDNGRAHYFEQNMHETINSTMRAYESMYPGFAKFVPQFFLDPARINGSWIAYNRPKYKVPTNYAPHSGPYLNRRQDSASLDFDGRDRDHDYTVMGFSLGYFSQGPDIYNRQKEQAAAAWATGFSTFSVLGFAEQNDLEPWQAFTMYAINHELGHTVARMAFGEMVTGKNHDTDYFQDSLIAQMEPVWKKHGIIAPDADLRYAKTSNGTSTRGDQGMNIMNANNRTLRAQLSEYGTTNLHEMMAETWVAYMMDPNPTEYVREAGAVLDDLLIQWLEDFDNREEDRGADDA